MSLPLTYNIRNLIERKGTTLMTALGIGLTVAVLVTAMALTAGLKSVFAGSGDPRQVLILRKGADAELTSTVSEDAYQIIRRLPGIALSPTGEPMVSPEGLTVVNLPSVDSPEGMNVTVRGMLPIGLTMRDIQITQGKSLTPGLRQVIVGESIAKRYPAAQVGQQVKFGRGTWEVVGVFRAGDSAANSEIWADLNQLRGDFERQGGSSSLLVRLDVPAATAEAQLADAQRLTEANKAKAAKQPAAPTSDADKKAKSLEVDPDFLKPFKKSIDNDQRLNCQVMSEKKYYADQTSSGTPIETLGFSVAVIMAIGSAFAATNTMYAAVSRRTREIGTLRALGFGRWTILRSFMLESICLALIGGIIGVLIALPVNGLTTGVGSFATFAETAFKFRITPMIIAVGLLFAAIIGAVGGFLPAWNASRKNIVQTMRDL
jgi:putative ABC transport system permease protein